MRIEFVNHASVIIEHDGIRLMTDPWIFGDAFNHGWTLLSESRFAVRDFDGIHYIWFSHEHPDHFNMDVLKSIANKNIKILFQNTLDHRVAVKCREMGFEVIELGNGARHPLGDDFHVTCVPVPYYDSWILFECGDTKILNLNDCVINDEEKLSAVKKITGKVDILLTQFGYAEGIATRDERVAASREKLEWLRMQSEHLGATYLIPFASFVRFTHRDNVSNNDGANDIRDVETFIRDRTGSIPIVMYPGDTWDGSGSHPNSHAISRYHDDMLQPIHPSTDAKKFPFGELVSYCNAYRATLRKKNNWTIIRLLHWAGVFRRVTIRVTDLGMNVSFDLIGGIRRADGDAVPDIAMDSDSLAFVFRFEYGADTLHVNGRYVHGPNTPRFFRMFLVGMLNNNGRNITYYVRKAIRRRIEG